MTYPIQPTACSHPITSWGIPEKQYGDIPECDMKSVSCLDCGQEMIIAGQPDFEVNLAKWFREMDRRRLASRRAA